MERIIVNLTGIVRNEKMEGRDYLVVPMVMMVEGVLNGSNGALYYPSEELAKVPQVWNHKPVVVYHPTMNGQALSACDPEVIDVHKVGVIMNTTYDGKRLKAEAWLETERVTQVDNRVLEALENNTMMEVSTGLFTENEEVEGEFNGEAYTAIARNYRPDHLAILPDQTGACSIEDGAGLLRVNAKSKKELNSTLEKLGLNINETSHGEIRTALYTALNDANPTQVNEYMDLWIEEVYDSYIIFNKDEKNYKQSYKIDKDGKASLEGMPEEVERKITYEPVNNILINSHSGGNKMDKEVFVGGLIANADVKWTEDDREWLMGLDEDILSKMEPVVNKAEGEPKVEETDDSTADDTTSETAPAQNQTAQEYLAAAPAELKEVLSDALQTHADKKSQLIAVITGNEKNGFTKDQLSSMSVNELTCIAALAENKKEEATPAGTPDYSGMRQVDNTAGVTKEEPLVAPTMNFSDDA